MLTLEIISKLEIKCFENALSKIDKEKHYEKSLSIMSGWSHEFAIIYLLLPRLSVEN